jgi:hypothetical protein
MPEDSSMLDGLREYLGTLGLTLTECIVFGLVILLVIAGPFMPRRIEDPVLATLAMIGLVAFVGIVGWFVAEPDLIIVFLIGCGLAVFDFWRTARGSGNGGDNGG